MSFLVDYQSDTGVSSWPLWFRPPDSNDAAAVHLAPGDGVFYRGRELIHFRHALPACGKPVASVVDRNSKVAASQETATSAFAPAPIHYHNQTPNPGLSDFQARSTARDAEIFWRAGRDLVPT